jgi:hypothetical protein
MQKQVTQWLIPALLAVGAVGVLWFYWFHVREAEPMPQSPAQPAVVTPRKAPDPVAPMPDSTSPDGERPALVPLPALDQSDDYFKLALADIFDDTLDDLLVSSGLIERIVASVDNLPRSHVAERIRPLDPLGGQFAIDGEVDAAEFTINAGNYERYDQVVDMVTGANLEELAEVYRRFYPLFQKSYVGLGYPEGHFNDRLIEVIDHLLQTPDIGDPVMLVRPHVLYEFADPDLESRSSGQKLLLRMGKEHRDRIKTTLRDFRAIATRL